MNTDWVFAGAQPQQVMPTFSITHTHQVLAQQGITAQGETCGTIESYGKRIHQLVPTTKKKRVDYTYAIHEAYYDKNGHVGAITQDPVEPFGENIEELRHSWVMMAEAFGKPVLDYDKIPEPGYERKEDPIGSVSDERLKELEAGNMQGIPWEHVKRELEEEWGPFDEEANRKQIEEERVEKERTHREAFVGIPTFEELINKIYSDYRDYIHRDRAENPWKYIARNKRERRRS